MNSHTYSNEKTLSGLISAVNVKHHITHNDNKINLNPLISIKDVHMHMNLSKIPQINMTNIIERPFFMFFQSHSILQDFALLFILLIVLFTVLVLSLVFYRRYQSSTN